MSCSLFNSIPCVIIVGGDVACAHVVKTRRRLSGAQAPPASQQHQQQQQKSKATMMAPQLDRIMCAKLSKALGCTFDLSTLHPAVPRKTPLSTVCIQHCHCPALSASLGLGSCPKGFRVLLLFVFQNDAYSECTSASPHEFWLSQVPARRCAPGTSAVRAASQTYVTGWVTHLTCFLYASTNFKT